MSITALVLGGIASAALGAAGGIGGSIAQGEYNKAEAQRNRDWQERMSNTAMQRAVKDYEAAGLSPAMMFASGGGNSASTPSGSAAQISKPELGIASVMNSVANIINTDRKLDLLEDLAEMNANTAQRRYTRKDLNSHFQSIDDIKI